MLDQKFIRNNPELVAQAARAKGEEVDVERMLRLDGQRRDILTRVEKLRRERNRLSEEVGRRKQAGEDAAPLIERVNQLAAESDGLDDKLRDVEDGLREILEWIPNIPHTTVPRGEDEVVRQWGEVPEFDFDPLPHWELGPRLGILDTERGGKIAGSGFVIHKGPGAKLQRALIDWMIDLHVSEHGYTEVWPPALTNEACLFGTGQLPKLRDDMYRVEDGGLYLIPTAEVPLTNLHRGEMLFAEDLPICYTACTPCFRREAGAHGRDTRGLTRVHQFDKVELVSFVEPATSYDELEGLVAHAEKILQLLELPYRVVNLCAGELSFAAAKTYDLEVWAPGAGKWLEVSSCSNFEDFQARRANIRFRRNTKSRPEYVHTLNGSGLALPRTVIGILENYQTDERTVIVPEVLRSRMGMSVLK